MMYFVSLLIESIESVSTIDYIIRLDLTNQKLTFCSITYRNKYEAFIICILLNVSIDLIVRGIPVTIGLGEMIWKRRVNMIIG